MIQNLNLIFLHYFVLSTLQKKIMNLLILLLVRRSSSSSFIILFYFLKDYTRIVCLCEYTLVALPILPITFNCLAKRLLHNMQSIIIKEISYQVNNTSVSSC